MSRDKSADNKSIQIHESANYWECLLAKVRTCMFDCCTYGLHHDSCETLFTNRFVFKIMIDISHSGVIFLQFFSFGVNSVIASNAVNVLPFWRKIEECEQGVSDVFWSMTNGAVVDKDKLSILSTMQFQDAVVVESTDTEYVAPEYENCKRKSCWVSFQCLFSDIPSMYSETRISWLEVLKSNE